MKSLAERQADRIQRKADNAAFSTADNIKGNVGLAAIKFAEFTEAISNLDDKQKEELKDTLRNEGDPFTADKDTYGDSYDGKGNLKSAGVGVSNPLIAPVSAQTITENEAGVSEGWADFVAEPKVNPVVGNEAGIALDAATSGGAGEGSGASEGGDGFPASEGSSDASSAPAKPARGSRSN